MLKRYLATFRLTGTSVRPQTRFESIAFVFPALSQMMDSAHHLEQVMGAPHTALCNHIGEILVTMSERAAIRPLDPLKSIEEKSLLDINILRVKLSRADTGLQRHEKQQDSMPKHPGAALLMKVGLRNEVIERWKKKADLVYPLADRATDFVYLGYSAFHGLSLYVLAQVSQHEKYQDRSTVSYLLACCVQGVRSRIFEIQSDGDIGKHTDLIVGLLGRGADPNSEIRS